MAVARLTVGQTQFKQRTVTVGLVAVVVAGNAPTDGGKGAEALVNLIVGIDAGLQGVQTLGLLGIVLLEGLYMVVADISAQAPFRRQLDVFSQTVEQGSRELRVESHEVSTHTEDVIGALVAVAHSEVDLG